MRVLYDNQIFSSQKFGGISRYFYELIKNLDNDVDYSLPIAFSNNSYIQEGDITPCKPFFDAQKFKGRTSLIKFFNMRLQKKNFKSAYDIFHPTYYDPYFLPYVDGKPFVLTIHDMTHEIFSLEIKQKNDWSVQGKKILAEKADKIIAVSENTKKDIVEILHIDPNKIDVIYHGCSLNPVFRKSLYLPERFILFVGDRSSYKNFDRLCEAFSSILQSDPDLKLICTGRSFSAKEQSNFITLGIEKNILNYSVTDEQLSELYSSALLFVFPSLYEGFGIPILEAFACGCPVVLSTASCFPEIAEDAALYFDPLDVNSMVSAIRLLIDDEQKRKELIMKGSERQIRFSWKKTASETCRLYKSLV